MIHADFASQILLGSPLKSGKRLVFSAARARRQQNKVLLGARAVVEYAPPEALWRTPTVAPNTRWALTTVLTLLAHD